MNFRDIAAKLDEIYWLINDNQKEMSDAEKPIVMDCGKARDIVYELILFFDSNKGSLLKINDVNNDLKCVVGQLEEVANRIERCKIIDC